MKGRVMNNNDERDYEEENYWRNHRDDDLEEEYEIPADYLSDLKTDHYFGWKEQRAEWGF